MEIVNDFFWEYGVQYFPIIYPRIVRYCVSIQLAKDRFTFILPDYFTNTAVIIQLAQLQWKYG